MARATYRITYTNGGSRQLDEDFVLLEIEAHSHADAMLIVENIERYFKGVTVTCDEPEEGSPKKREREGRRPQRAKKDMGCGGYPR